MAWRRRTAVVTILAAAALLAPAADASWTIKGRGFGHGAGLSQYGAFGFAEQGRSYEQIIDHYYRNTELGKASGERVRVLLGSSGDSVGFRGAGKACGESLNSGKQYSFEAEGAGVVLRSPDGGRIKACRGEGRASGPGGVRIGGFGRYRGDLVVRNEDGLMVINQVDAEGYVKGVVPNEVPSSWPVAALRAQAVVARSYGIATERSGPFDHYDDTRSQVYGGRDSETEKTNRAVAATKREVVTHQGEPAVTYYFSTSGGRTESSEFAFPGGNRIPYLRSVKDPYDDASPVHKWTERLSDEEMENELTGLFGGSLKEIDIIERGDSPRIVRARVVGSSDSTVVTGDTLRNRLDLRSTWARFAHR